MVVPGKRRVGKVVDNDVGASRPCSAHVGVASAVVKHLVYLFVAATNQAAYRRRRDPAALPR
jgi:hypothetical protein